MIRKKLVKRNVARFFLTTSNFRRKDFIKDKIYTLADFTDKADLNYLLNLFNQRETDF